MSNGISQLPSTIRREVQRDTWIIAGAVAAVAVAVTCAVLFMSVWGLITIAALTVVVGGVKQINDVIKGRYEQAIESLQLLVTPQPGLLQVALQRLGWSKSEVPATDEMRVEAEALITKFEHQRARAAEWSSAAGLIVWVLGLGTALTAALQLLAPSI